MKEPLVILHVDDDEDDLFIIGEALKAEQDTLHIVSAGDGNEALRYLQENKAAPHLIILDINMPGMDGRETLKHLKQNEQWKTIPTVVLSTSSDPLDKQFCNRFEVDLLTKPMEINEVRKTAQQLLQYV